MQDPLDNETDASRPRRFIEAVVAPDSYAMVLLLILLTYVLSVTLTEGWAGSLVLVVQMTTVWVVLRTSQAPRLLRVVAEVALVVALVAAVLGVVLHKDTTELFLPAVSCLLYLVAPFCIARHLLRRPAIDLETVLGALATYALIGMFFGFLYRSVGANDPSPFFGTQGDGSLPQDLFFSFTTLTTTGYGNLVPADNPGQTFAVGEMLIGQLFLVTALAKVINSYRPGQRGGLRSSSEDG